MAARKKQAPRMSEEDRRFIYQVLKRNFTFDEEYPLANLGWCFLREDIDKADYGFIKLKPMLEEMSDFVSTSTKEVGGVSQSMFTLHEFDSFENESKNGNEAKQQKELKSEKKSKTKKDSKIQIDTNKEKETAPEQGKESSREADSGCGTASGKDASQDGAAASGNGEGAGGEGEKPQKRSSSESSKRKRTPSAKGRASEEESTAEPRESEASTHSAEEAKPASAASNEPPAKKPSKKKDSSESSSAEDSGKKQSAKEDEREQREQTRASRGGRKNASPQGKSIAQPPRLRLPRGRVIPGKALERFADLGSWPDFLSMLASLALEEPWDFCEVPGIDSAGAPSKRYDILHNYIRYTYYRLTLEDKVAFSDDEDFAVFNTGLVDKHYEDIYACFEPSPADGRQPWTFAGFCTAGTGRLGKRLVREMNPLPQPASYLQRKEDLLFDLDREVVCDIRHIVVDNVHRLPINFLRDELASSAECRGILAGIEDLTERGRAARFEKLRAAIADDPRLFTRLSNSINAAIDQARRQVRWNYKTAVPAYYPRTNTMSLLLPLNLTESTKPDVALVVELQKSGNYQGQTIVTMAQAYRDARLLCRPYIDWLSPASIIDAASEEEEEEED